MFYSKKVLHYSARRREKFKSQEEE